MTFDEVAADLIEQFGPSVRVGPEVAAGDRWLDVDVESLWPVATYLRESAGFDYLNSVTAVDYFFADEKKAAKAPWEPHIEVVYHLTNMSTRLPLTFKVALPRWRAMTPGELPQCPSVAGLWSTADWHEREAYDLLGIEFTGHPNLVRILCPEDWVGHPLRKDYEMPLEYHGIRGR